MGRDARPTGGVRLVFPALRRAIFPFRSTVLAPVSLALLLCACDVRVEDTTPSAYPAEHGIGMYELSAHITADPLVTPHSVVLFAISDGQKLTLTPDADFRHYRGLYSVRCHDSFPLQLYAVWRLQGLTTARKLLPAQPRQIRLIEPPQPREARFDASGKAPHGGWQGGVPFRFVTVPGARITAARIEPASGSAEDVAAARAISVTTALPVDADCGTAVQVRLAASDPHAHGTLVIDTDHPAVPHWQTRVEFYGSSPAAVHLESRLRGAERKRTGMRGLKSERALKSARP
ncbi:MAG TPA: hypothetical protein VIE42_07510 [Steroidobacteraceae bacterium]|jgi:hypothetical protein